MLAGARGGVARTSPAQFTEQCRPVSIPIVCWPGVNFCFDGNKIVTSGGGGALVANYIKPGKRAKYAPCQKEEQINALFLEDRIAKIPSNITE